MVPDMFSQVSETTPQQTLQALKTLKYSIIGNDVKKQAISSDQKTLELLLSYLDHSSADFSYDICEQASVILASLSAGSVKSRTLFTVCDSNAYLVVLTCLEFICTKVKTSEFNVDKYSQLILSLLRSIQAYLGDQIALVVLLRPRVVACLAVLLDPSYHIPSQIILRSCELLSGLCVDISSLSQAGFVAKSLISQIVARGTKSTRTELQTNVLGACLKSLADIIPPRTGSAFSWLPNSRSISQLTASALAPDQQSGRSILEIVPLCCTLTSDLDHSVKLYANCLLVKLCQDSYALSDVSGAMITVAPPTPRFHPEQSFTDIRHLVAAAAAAAASETEMGISVSADSSISRIKFKRSEILSRALPVLIDSLSTSPADPTALHCLAILCREGGEINERAYEANLISTCGSIIEANIPAFVTKSESESREKCKLLSCAFNAVAALCSCTDSYRIKASNELMFEHALSVLTVAKNNSSRNPDIIDAESDVIIAALQMLRVLSRCTSLLRTEIVNFNVLTPLIELMRIREDVLPQTADIASFMERGIYGCEPVSSDAAFDLQPSDMESCSDPSELVGKMTHAAVLKETAAISAVLCNLSLDMCPLRSDISTGPILGYVIRGTWSSYTPLRLNSIWILKHLLYDSEYALKKSVLLELVPEHVLKLCNDPVLDIQEQALNLIRNFVCRGKEEVDFLYTQIGADRLLDIVCSKLLALIEVEGLEIDLERIADIDDDVSMDDCTRMVDQERGGDYARVVSDTAVAATYICVHILATGLEHRDKIAHNLRLMKMVHALLKSNYEEVRRACLWLIINLTWIESHTDNDYIQKCVDITDSIARLGLRARLEECMHDTQLDVRERAKTALFQLDTIFDISKDTDARVQGATDAMQGQE
ncbi:hypothetical protein CANCADRAFT_101212 [Tortispora caseinolytica NRRL Y-17796]|uniref:Armadillo repeat-containing protein 8 n=1 Tax=Tortispora caseinolytica NRRL Y-17796 TaxID=767744 RepID=A0A1E4TEC5_9ASCO|nr:hypothetical protein CANCADRAFT_101212 [Tortispora caseinolytica NRRL Y-17796]